MFCYQQPLWRRGCCVTGVRTQGSGLDRLSHTWPWLWPGPTLPSTESEMAEAQPRDKLSEEGGAGSDRTGKKPPPLLPANLKIELPILS